jgi:hypothetical protein
MEIHNQTGKLATDIRTWIVSEMRRRGAEMAKRGPYAPCADLMCFKDAELLAEVDDLCLRSPGDDLTLVVFQSSFILHALKLEDELHREDRDEKSK